MKHRSKRFLSILLSLTLVLGLAPVLPFPALADNNNSTYTVTIPSKVTVTQAGWNDTPGISATGSLPPKTMLVVTADSDGEFALTSRLNEKIPYFIHSNKMIGEYVAEWGYDEVYRQDNLDHPAPYEFPYLSSSPTTQPLGVVVKEYDGMRSGTYTDTVTFTAKVDVLSLKYLTGDYTAEDGDILTGEQPDPYNIFVPDGATVIFRDMVGVGINCLGDATIILEGENEVYAGEAKPGIHIPQGKTLTIRGNGSLYARGYTSGAAIGGGREISCGNIVIESGTIDAYAKEAAAIGGGEFASCGNITIKGGTVTAISDGYGAAIGSSSDDTLHENSCGDILITGGTVHATANGYGAAIGSGLIGACGNITITNTVKKVTAIRTKDAPYINPFTGNTYNPPACIGKGGEIEEFETTCGTIRIGGKVYQSIYQNEFIYQP